MTDLAVITGASGAIGSAVARRVHAETNGELAPVLCCLQHRGAAESLAAELPGAKVVQADLTTAAGRRTLLDEVISHGTPYLLVNCAGVSGPHETALDISEAAASRILRLNLETPLLLMSPLAREMTRGGGGVIVNVTSVLASRPLAGSAVYGAAKAGLEALTRQFALELGPRGIRVNAVSPGYIESPMTAAMTQSARASELARIPLGTFGDASHVAAAVWHLVDNPYATGVVLTLDGGLSL